MKTKRGQKRGRKMSEASKINTLGGAGKRNRTYSVGFREVPYGREAPDYAGFGPFTPLYSHTVLEKSGGKVAALIPTPQE